MDAKTIDILVRAHADLSDIKKSTAAMEELKAKAATLRQNLQMGAVGGAGFAAANLFGQLPAQMNDVINKGVAFNATLESARLGVAAVLKQFDAEGKFASFDAAMAESSKALDLLKKAAAESPATFEQLVQAYQGTAGAMASSGMSIQQQVQTIVTMSQTLAGLGIRSEQILQETRALLTGDITEDAAAARILGITKTMVETAKSEGGLYDFLMEKTSAFAEAGKRGASTYETAMSNVEDVFTQTAGELTKDIFVSQREGFLKLTQAMQTEGFRDGMKSLLSVGMEFQNFMAGSKVWLAEHGKAVSVVAEALKAMGVAYLGVNGASFLKNLILSTEATAASTAAFAQETIAVNANTAALAKNAMARGAGSALVGPGAAWGGALPTPVPSRGAPYSKDAYDSARKMGMPADKALDAARRAMFLAEKEGAASISAWTNLGGAISAAKAKLAEITGSFFTFRGMLAAEAARQGVEYASTAVGDYMAGDTLGTGPTNAEDMARANAIRDHMAAKHADFSGRIQTVTTQEQAAELGREIMEAANKAAAEGTQKGTWGHPRGAQNDALQRASNQFTLLLEIIAKKSQALPTQVQFGYQLGQQESRDRAEVERKRQGDFRKMEEDIAAEHTYKQMSPEQQLAELGKRYEKQTGIANSYTSSDEEKKKALEEINKLLEKGWELRDKIAEAENAALGKRAEQQFAARQDAEARAQAPFDKLIEQKDKRTAMADELALAEAAGDPRKAAQLKWQQDYEKTLTQAREAGMGEDAYNFAIRRANSLTTPESSPHSAPMADRLTQIGGYNSGPAAVAQQHWNRIQSATERTAAATETLARRPTETPPAPRNTEAVF